MKSKTTASRRSFLKGGALVAAPLTAAGAVGVIAHSEHAAQLVRLKDEAAIRDLHQAWLRRVNTGEPAQAALLFADPKAGLHKSITRVAADHAGAPDAISLAPDGMSASGLYHCAVETETPRPLDCTLAQMAQAQGEGMLRHSERRVLKARYVRADEGWAIDTLRFEPA